jgi:hypothetical protein
MSNYTKNQIESDALSAKDLLLSWTSGAGATGKTPALYDHVKTGEINNIPVSVELLTALAEMYTVKGKCSERFYEAIKYGYLSPNHFDEYKETSLAQKPLEGHYLTAVEYMQSCFAMLPELPKPSIEDVLAHFVDYKSSMTKPELQTLIEGVIKICTVRSYGLSDLTDTQFAKYNDLVKKENAMATALFSLSTYMDDIKPIAGSDCSVQGKFFPERGHGEELNRLLTEEKYTILVTTSIPAKLDSSFNIVESGYILFSIKVI